MIGIILINKSNVVIVEKSYELAENIQEKVAIDETTTPVSGKDLSVIDELIGNFGRFPANNKSGR